MSEETTTKRRGRPSGTAKKDPKEGLKMDLTTTTYEPKKRGRKAIPKDEAKVVVEVPLEDEVEGSTTEKLKNFAKQLEYVDHLLDMEPYRMDLRVIKNNTVARMCYLIGEL
jgi:hypothetical protein